MLYSNYLRDKSQNAIKIGQSEGYPCILKHSKGKYLKDYEIYGNSYQATVGKNLFDKSKSNLVSIQEETVGNYWGSTMMDNQNTMQIFQPNITYTVSCDIECIEVPMGENITLYEKDLGLSLYSGVSGYSTYSMYTQTQIEQGKTYHFEKTITTGSNLHDDGANYRLLVYANRYVDENNNGVLPKVIFRNIQIEEGSVATSYEPYHDMPSPDYPSEVQSVGELTTKNLLNMDAYIIKTNYQINSTTGDLMYCGAARYAIETFIEVEPNTAYVISGKWKNEQYTQISLFSYDNSKNYISPIPSKYYFKDDLYYRTFTISDNCKYIRFFYELIENLQLEIGDTPTEYEPYGKYKIPVTVRGKNLLDRNLSQMGYCGNKYITPNGYSIDGILWSDLYKYSGQTTAVWYITYPIPIKPNTFYTYSGLQSANNPAFIFLEEDKTTIISGKPIRYYDTFKTPDNARYIVMSIYANYVKTMMLEESETVTEYEPYHAPIQTNIYLDEPLRKVGDYADYIDFGKSEVVRKVFEESLNIASIYNKKANVVRFSGNYLKIKQAPDYNILSHVLKYYVAWSGNEECIFHHTNNANFYWSIYWYRLGLTYDGTNVYRADDTNQTPLTNNEIIEIANNWLLGLSDEDKKIYMIMETPTSTPILLPKLPTVKGTTILEVDTLIKPTNIKSKYIKL